VLHVAEAVVPDSVHAPPKVPVWLVARLTVPVGVMNVPGEVSVTVTLHVAADPIVTDAVQLILVEVALGLTTILAVPLLEL
jgi:hypothetical protein